MIIALTLLQANLDLVADKVEMDAFSWIFMLLSMGSVTLLTIWTFARIIGGKKHFDPDGVGPARPPEPGKADRP